MTNALSLRETLVRDGAIFRTTSDTETIVQLIAKSQRDKFAIKPDDDLKGLKVKQLSLLSGKSST